MINTSRDYDMRGNKLVVGQSVRAYGYDARLGVIEALHGRTVIGWLVDTPEVQRFESDAGSVLVQEDTTYPHPQDRDTYYEWCKTSSLCSEARVNEKDVEEAIAVENGHRVERGDVTIEALASEPLSIKDDDRSYDMLGHEVTQDDVVTLWGERENGDTYKGDLAVVQSLIKRKITGHLVKDKSFFTVDIAQVARQIDTSKEN